MYALLPMKEHSERIPNKNYKRLFGKPLFFYILDTLRETEIFDATIINTDSSTISALASARYGQWVKIIKRPEKLKEVVAMVKLLHMTLT